MTRLTKGFIFVFFFCAVTNIFAQSAVIQDLIGTVEIKTAGSAVWESARKGQALAPDTVISTAFRSTALVQAGSSVITVKPLTRMTLSEIIVAEGAETLNVNLQAGRVRVDVTPPAGTKATTTVTTPTATASVRGTAFEIDTVNLVVFEGTVVFYSSGVPVLVDAGRTSYVNEQNGRVALPEETTNFRPELPFAFSGSASSADSLDNVDLDVTVGFEQ